MAWYTLNIPSKVMWLTDYFGTNLPRWAMSHVDPILLIFVPIFAIWPHSMTLVIIQLVLVIFSSLIIYKIARLELGSEFSGFFYGLAFLFYPAVGFLLAFLFCKASFLGIVALLDGCFPFALRPGDPQTPARRIVRDSGLCFNSRGDANVYGLGVVCGNAFNCAVAAGAIAPLSLQLLAQQFRRRSCVTASMVSGWASPAIIAMNVAMPEHDKRLAPYCGSSVGEASHPGEHQ